ncbi:MAG: tRNA pseudouridine(55) synthase TruB [Bacilli bacterium]|nr:tRNA pseudouridine(55) synthase TruB [Bacilli bacterium]
MKHGILLVRKAVGMTSYDVIRVLKRQFKTKKVGHAGTLDPFASGLLIVGLNEGTKILPYLENQSKEYIAELTLGKMTDTYDVTGKVIEQKKPKKHTKEEIRAVLESFLGEIKQVPPIYSAIKLKGKPLYKYARKNQAVKVKERTQHIYDIKLIHYEDNQIIFYAKVDKGTYIRSLGVDIAKKLNEVGYLSNLERNGIGEYKIAESKKLECILEKHVIEIKDALKFKQVKCPDYQKIKNGAPIKLACHDDYVIMTHQGVAVAIYAYNKRDMLYYCERGFHYESL